MPVGGELIQISMRAKTRARHLMARMEETMENPRMRCSWRSGASGKACQKVAMEEEGVAAEEKESTSKATATIAVDMGIGCAIAPSKMLRWPRTETEKVDLKRAMGKVRTRVVEKG